MLTWLQRDSLQFPPLAKAMREPNGLLAAGGDLSADRLISAYPVSYTHLDVYKRQMKRW